MSLRFRYRTADGIRDGEAESPEDLAGYDLAIPIEPPEVWCAGVTYERSRDARVEESTVKDVYTLVYDADRPELFLKDAACRRTVGPGEPIGVRSDSAWDVPEPEPAAERVDANDGCRSGARSICPVYRGIGHNGSPFSSPRRA